MLNTPTGRSRDQDGFTLIEMLVVVLIIGILAAIAIPLFLNQRHKAYDAAAKSNLRTAATAEYVYTSDNNSGFASETMSSTDAGPLASIEPVLRNAPFVTATANGTTGFTLVSSAEGNGGDVFTYIDNNGAVILSCSGSGGGCANSSW